MQEKRNSVTGCFGAIWRGIDAVRRVAVNLLFLFVLGLLLILLVGEGPPLVPSEAVLVVAPEGDLVEQKTGDAVQQALDELTGSVKPETLVRDVVDAIDAARDDERIQAILLDLDGLDHGGLTKLEEIFDALTDFRAAGKTVVAAADGYDQTRYYLAAAADEVHLHPEGLMLLEGFSRYPLYFKDAIDRLELDWNVFKVGHYKTAVEPFTETGMSQAAQDANLDWLGDLWRSYVEDVAAARGLEVAAVNDFIEQFPAHLQRTGGHMAQAALEAGLIDHVSHRDQVRSRLVELVGEDEESHSYPQIGLEDYLLTLDREPGSGDAVGVVVAKGDILDGEQPPGTIGGDSTAALVRQARLDEQVKAVVLRVDSGGGSAFASEIIRRECELTRQAGKPVVVSMGTLAASGGYWIATASDEIWASPNTLTGSIGIFAMFPTYQKPLAKHLGIRVDGVGTTELAGALRPDRELSQEAKDVIRTVVEKGYRDFLGHVSEARGITPEEVDRIAQGRVWSGADAYDRGLVDQLGGLDDAIASAAALAGLEEDHAVVYVEEEPTFEARLVAGLFSRVAAVVEPAVRLRQPALPGSLLRFLERQTETLRRFDDPRGLYAHCLCEVE